MRPLLPSQILGVQGKSLTKIRDVIGLTNEPRSTVHNSQVMSRAVLKDFEDNFLVPNQLKYKDLMQIGP